jgi:hypothetical protein
MRESSIAIKSAPQKQIEYRRTGMNWIISQPNLKPGNLCVLFMKEFQFKGNILSTIYDMEYALISIRIESGIFYGIVD